MSHLQSGVPIKFDMTGLPTDRPVSCSTYSPINTDFPQLFCQILVGGQPQALSQPVESCALPVDSIDGPVFMFITDDAHPLASNILSQNHESIQAGPAIAYVDKQEAVLSKLVLHDGLHGHHNKALDDVKVLGVQYRWV